MYLNSFIVSECCRSGRTRDLATFLFLKNKFQNSTVYNISKAKGLGLSRNTIKKYTERFVDMGWCEIKGNNLFFKQVNRIVAVNGAHRKFLNLEGSINEIMQRIRLLVLQQKQEQFEWVMKKENRNKNLSPEEYLDATWDLTPRQLLLRDLPKRLLEVYENCHFFISFKTIGKLFSCCAARARAIIIQMQRAGMIRVFKKELGFLKKRYSVLDRTMEGEIFKARGGNEVFEGRPSKDNWCNFNKFCFPNSYIFSL